MRSSIPDTIYFWHLMNLARGVPRGSRDSECALPGTPPTRSEPADSTHARQHWSARVRIRQHGSADHSGPVKTILDPCGALRTLAYQCGSRTPQTRSEPADRQESRPDLTMCTRPLGAYGIPTVGSTVRKTTGVIGTCITHTAPFSIAQHHSHQSIACMDGSGYPRPGTPLTRSEPADRQYSRPDLASYSPPIGSQRFLTVGSTVINTGTPLTQSEPASPTPPHAA
jgi:hypothetical protein